MADEDDKSALIAKLASARSELFDNTVALRADLDVAAHARKSFKGHPLPWIGGAAVAGLILARLAPGRRPKKTVTLRRQPEPTIEKAGKAGVVLGVMKMAFDFARPAATAWARKRVADYLAERRAPDDSTASRRV